MQEGGAAQVLEQMALFVAFNKAPVLSILWDGATLLITSATVMDCGLCADAVLSSCSCSCKWIQPNAADENRGPRGPGVPHI